MTTIVTYTNNTQYTVNLKNSWGYGDVMHTLSPGESNQWSVPL